MTDQALKLRPCAAGEAEAIGEIINAAAEAYRGVIPADQWSEPYMPADKLAREMAAGVVFWGAELDGRLVGVMGVQRSGDVDLIRHAYVRPAQQGAGIGAALLTQLVEAAERPVLVGTWADAAWAIRFYERHGFHLAAEARKRELLRRYWTVPERQMEVSVVLARDL